MDDLGCILSVSCPQFVLDFMCFSCSILSPVCLELLHQALLVFLVTSWDAHLSLGFCIFC
jgi:hypothetical protein